MSKDVSFQLDTQGGQTILEKMMMPVVKKRGEAIAARASTMAGSISSDPPVITVTAKTGTIRRGVRAIATITAEGKDAHENYIGHVALARAMDAGRN